MTYKRMYGLSQQQFCDEMFRGYQHLVNFDFKHARKETRQYACTFDTELTGDSEGWYAPKYGLEEYGFNAIKLDDEVDLAEAVGHGASDEHAEEVELSAGKVVVHLEECKLLICDHG